MFPWVLYRRGLHLPFSPLSGVLVFYNCFSDPDQTVRRVGTVTTLRNDALEPVHAQRETRIQRYHFLLATAPPQTRVAGLPLEWPPPSRRARASRRGPTGAPTPSRSPTPPGPDSPPLLQSRHPNGALSGTEEDVGADPGVAIRSRRCVRGWSARSSAASSRVGMRAPAASTSRRPGRPTSRV